MTQAPGERHDLTTGQAAAFLGVSPMSVIRYVERGQLSCKILPSGHRRFRRSDLDALLRDSQKQAAS